MLQTSYLHDFAWLASTVNLGSPLIGFATAVSVLVLQPAAAATKAHMVSQQRHISRCHAGVDMIISSQDALLQVVHPQVCYAVYADHPATGASTVFAQAHAVHNLIHSVTDSCAVLCRV